jgi:hypothetical protein
MSSWQDLEQQFRDLESTMQHSRLDRHWDEATEQWRLAGGADPLVERRFAALAALAGKLLTQANPSAVPAEVAEETDPARRWYGALWHLGGPHEPPLVGQLTRDGQPEGYIFVGSIDRPAHASSVLALRLQAVSDVSPSPVVATRPGPIRRGRLNDWLEREAAQRGRFWTVVAILMALILAALAVL